MVTSRVAKHLKTYKIREYYKFSKLGRRHTQAPIPHSITQTTAAATKKYGKLDTKLLTPGQLPPNSHNLPQIFRQKM